MLTNTDIKTKSIGCYQDNTKETRTLQLLVSRGRWVFSSPSHIATVFGVASS